MLFNTTLFRRSSNVQELRPASQPKKGRGAKRSRLVFALPAAVLMVGLGSLSCARPMTTTPEPTHLSGSKSMHYLLMYDAGPDYVTRRTPYRAAHLAHAQDAVNHGDLLLAGAVGPADGAPAESSAFLFQGNSPAAAEAFARTDPYVTSGVVKTWRVSLWATVVGPMAANPLPKP